MSDTRMIRLDEDLELLTGEFAKRLESVCERYLNREFPGFTTKVHIQLKAIPFVTLEVQDGE